MAFKCCPLSKVAFKCCPLSNVAFKSCPLSNVAFKDCPLLAFKWWLSTDSFFGSAGGGGAGRSACWRSLASKVALCLDAGGGGCGGGGGVDAEEEAVLWRRSNVALIFLTGDEPVPAVDCCCWKVVCCGGLGVDRSTKVMFSDVRLGVSVPLSSRTGWLRTDVISIDNLGRVNVLGSNRFVGGAENHLENNLLFHAIKNIV